LASQIKVKPVHFISTISIAYPNNPDVEVIREQDSIDDAKMPSLKAYFEEDRLPLQVENFGSVFSLTISDRFALLQDSDSPDIRLILLYYNLIYKGILLRGNGGFLSTAHTDEDINSIIQAVQDSIIKLRKEGFFDIIFLSKCHCFGN